MAGWVKLYRSFRDWEWYDSPSCKVVFIDLLLSANHKEGSYRGVTLPAGSLTTSQAKIAERTGLTIKQVRSALIKLEGTGEVHIKSTRQFSMITIVKWDKYQQEDGQEGEQGEHRGADGGQTEGTQRATSKNARREEGKKGRSIIPLCSDDLPRQVIACLNSICGRKFDASKESSLKWARARIKDGFTLEEFSEVFKHKASEWKNDSKMHEFLRPETLLGNKFEGYLQAARSAPEADLEPGDIIRSLLPDDLKDTGIPV